MIEAQLVTGATQDIRIFTGSAHCAAPVLSTMAAATADNNGLNVRMGRSSGMHGRRPWGRFDATLQSGTDLGKGRIGAVTIEVRPLRYGGLRRDLLQHAPLGLGRKDRSEEHTSE